MKLYALSDLHINYPINRDAIKDLTPHPADWLILGGDCCDTRQDLEWLLDELGPKWQQLIWVPGNHELWTRPDDAYQARGKERYQGLIDTCRERGVYTPEDPYPCWPNNKRIVIAPLFLLYDYSFGPKGMTREQVLEWSAAQGIRCADERFLQTEPYPSPEAWCHERIRWTKERLDRLPPDVSTVLINHFPLRSDLVRLYNIPRFAPWCGTEKTNDWHRQYRARVVVSGHLHMRATDWKDGVRFEEVSIGYPRHWRSEQPLSDYLREILPGPRPPANPPSGPTWLF